MKTEIVTKVTFSQLTMKALLLSVITEIKFGQPLASNAKHTKAIFKDMVGLKKSATNVQVIQELHRVYKENQIEQDFRDTLTKFKVAHLIN